MPGILQYELNEVPWRVVDRQVSRRPEGPLASLLHASDTYTTRTVDSGELHPWTTWPTMHRGVANDVHGIRFLNQDLEPSDRWPPVWRLLAGAGVPVGVFGSLQSYPLERGANVEFHVPDTFAPAPDTHPPALRAFQAFNLKQAGRNKAVASRVGIGDALDGLALLRSGIRPGSWARVARHLVAERRDSLHRKRRPLLQPVLAFDVFEAAVRASSAQYATFFTNHVAGIMHRYWRHAFPGDFAEPISDDPEARFDASSLDAAMDIVDDQLRRLVALAHERRLDLVVCSSMGQEAIDRGAGVPELLLTDFGRLSRGAGLPEGTASLPAMQPDVTLTFRDSAALDAGRARLESLRDREGNPLLTRRYPPVGNTLTMQLGSGAVLHQDPRVRLDERSYPLSELGFSTAVRDVGTGYHQPEGVLIWRREGTESEPDARRTVIDSRRFAPSVLDRFAVAAPDYMMEPLPTRR